MRDGRVATIASETSEGRALPHSFPVMPEDSECFTFEADTVGFISFDIPSGVELPSGMQLDELREISRGLPASRRDALAKGAELLAWNRTFRFCPKCGCPLHRATEISKKCNCCDAEYFPTLSPCVIVLVTRGDQGEEALLVHAKTFTRPFFGLVAGFVETGESLEQSVRREVLEETGLEIDDVRYYGSQTWPYPHQLMIGFTARWKSGEIRFADGELSDGGFFRRDSIPQIPSPPSIARRMIDDWLSNRL